MKDVLRPILELTVILPGLLLSYFPVKSYLKQSPGRLAAWVLPLLAGFCTAGGLICYNRRMSIVPALVLIVLFTIVLYVSTLRISLWKSGSIVLSACAVFSCINSLCSIFMHQQPVQSRQRSNCDACTGNGAGAVVLL